MKKASSLFILFLLLMGCQREFPPAPDHSTRSVSLTENWKFNMPDGERAIWIDAGEDDVLYLTVSTDKVCTYLFSYDGELLKKQAFTHSRLVSYLEENSAKRRNNNWLSTSYLSHSVFLNYETGESHIVLEDEELVKDSSFNYYLFKDDVCYYNKVDEQKNYQLIQWNLKTGGKQVLDTLITATYLTDRLSVLGSYRKPMGNIDANLLYLSRGFERFNDVYAFNLLGYATDNFFGNKKWESPVLFRNDDPFYKGKVVFNDAVCYFNISKTLYCLDPVHQQIRWSRSFSNGIASEIEFYDNKLYFTLTNGVTYCLNASNSEIIWTKKLGAYVYKMDTDRQLLGVVGLKEIDDDKLFSDYTNQLQIIEARTGKELYCSDDPLTKGNVPINDPRKGLSNVVAQSDNIIFLADDTHFFSMRIRREN